MPNPTESAPQNKKSFHIPHIVRRIIAVLLIGAVVLTVWTYRSYLAPEFLREWVQTNLLGYTDGDGYPVLLGDNTVNRGNLTVENDSPALVGKTAYLYLSGGGKTLALRQHGYTNPVLTRCGKRILVYDLGGKNFRVSENGVDFTETAQYDYTIYTGAIAANGNYAIVSSSAGYTAQVAVFDRNGQKLFSWASQNYLIGSVAFSGDGTHIVTTAFTSHNGELDSTVIVFSLSSEQPLVTHDLDENIALDACFTDSNTVLLVGDRAAVTLHIPTRKAENYNYNGRVLSAYDIHTSGALLALSASEDGRNGTLIALDAALNDTQVLRFSFAMDSIQLCENGILTLSNGSASFYAFDGTCLDTMDVGSDALSACFDNGKCYVLGVSEIRAFPIKHTVPAGTQSTT